MPSHVPDTAPDSSTAPLPVLPPLAAQAERLVALGVARLAGISPDDLRALAAQGPDGALLVIHPSRLLVHDLAPLMTHRDKPGFVVTDMTDVDAFTPIEAATPPDAPAYLLSDVQRGDEMANWSPNEALPAIIEAGRTPLLLTEGVQWLLHQPAALEGNHCFMTIGSRLTKPNGQLDARTPAIWISSGTGRDGASNRHAPKVGWCWAGNRHTWLGFASATARRA